MITVVWKELRENARWATLGFVAVAAALILEWQTSPLVFDGGYSLNAVFTAIALGILQTRRDKRPAARALLLHRGITADAAFAGKLLGGFALYSMAVFVPLLGLAVFIATNGIEHKAASPISLVPAALWTLAAFGFWPAALLVVQRDARIFGSRLTPVVLALLVVFPLSGSYGNALLFVTWLISALGLFVLLLAARSVFANSGQIATGTGRAALAYAVSVAFLLGFLILGMVIDSYRMSNVHEIAGAAAGNGRYAVRIGPEGQPWLQRENDLSQDGSYQLTQAAKLASGRSVREQLQPIDDDWKKTPTWLVDTDQSLGARGSWTRFTQIANESPSSSAGHVQREWVLDHKSDTILVYHRTSSDGWRLARRLRVPRPITSFGEVRRHFPRDTDGNFTLVTSTGAFYIPGDGSAIITMYQAPTTSTILDSVEQPQAGNRRFAMMLRLTDRVVLLESGLDENAASRVRPIGAVGNMGSLNVTEIQVPNELVVSQSLSIARDPVHNGAYIGLAQSGYSYRCRILWARFDANGQIAARQQYIENTSPDNVYGASVFVAFMPLGVWALGTGVALVDTDDYSLEEVWEETRDLARENPARTAQAALLFLLQPLVGVSLAIWAARRRRLGKRQTWLCIAWGFLLGPAGSLSVLAVYPRIARDRCISCQQPTRIDLDHCEHCSHPADDVPKIGIEIFGRSPLTPAQPLETISSC